MKIAKCIVVLIVLSSGCVAAGADGQLQWSVRKSQVKNASTCKIVAGAPAYAAELVPLKLSPMQGAPSQTTPQLPNVDWAHGAKALIFARGTDGKMEYIFKRIDGSGAFSFESAPSSRFPDSEVIIVHLPSNYAAASSPACLDGSIFGGGIGGGRSRTVFDAGSSASHSYSVDSVGEDHTIYSSGGTSGSKSAPAGRAGAQQ
jgi:hypothetical protein